MLDIMKTESKNEVYVSGILNEFDIVEGTTADGRDWVRGTAEIKVDQEINGVMTESIVSNKMFSMRLKKDNSPNKLYDIILGYKNNFTSAAAAEDISEASRVTVAAGKLTENVWVDNTGKEHSSFQINSNFMNKKKDNDIEGATFQLSGVVIKMQEETDREDTPTGRLILKFGVIGYAGKIDILTLIAEGNAKVHIEQNWQEGDTVKVAGKINMTQKTIEVVEEQGFGEAIKSSKTIFSKELIITSGSAGSLEENNSYDADSIKKACLERLTRIEELKNKQSKSTVKNSKQSSPFGF